MGQILGYIGLALAYIFIAIPGVAVILDPHASDYSYGECWGAGLVIHVIAVISILIAALVVVAGKLAFT